MLCLQSRTSLPILAYLSSLPVCSGYLCVQTISDVICFCVWTVCLNLNLYVTTMLLKVIWKGTLIKQHSWLARKFNIVT